MHSVLIMKMKALSLMIFLLFPVTLIANTTSCPLSNGINVHSAKQILNICKNGIIIKSFKVALGNNGVGKKHAGDNKTPVGIYNLAHPRKSNQFKVFIPIGYPTKQQLNAGYTGRDVGIHGPTQIFSGFNWLNNLPYATRGCIAVGKNNYIEYVANWVKQNPGAKIFIS